MADTEDTGQANMKIESAKGKFRWSLLSWPTIRLMVEVMEHGTEKHAANDWKKGAPWSLYFDALHRHIDAWWEGETIDPDSGKHHLTHAMCCAMILVWYHIAKIGVDDRPTLYMQEAATISQEVWDGIPVEVDSNLGDQVNHRKWLNEAMQNQRGYNDKG